MAHKVSYRLTFTSRASGQSVEMGMTEMFTVRGALVAELDVYYKNPLRMLLC
ncbi:hypothetical protein [Mycobacterium sp. ITM-2016-00318]|uniref:hypothetical protein n=1 Tax=Mycobacterium sp. ITM-2016-00318 TaxID=2099693 RepID=UPI001304DF2B|nr:hypothetical protein [Mycobacterium sp. ITM-2016-00318]WNG93209.1 hypothetical protein C6A82_001590 [Mycobacterium sp. ITM-2016-00318]